MIIIAFISVSTIQSLSGVLRRPQGRWEKPRKGQRSEGMSGAYNEDKAEENGKSERSTKKVKVSAALPLGVV